MKLKERSTSIFVVPVVLWQLFKKKKERKVEERKGKLGQFPTTKAEYANQ